MLSWLWTHVRTFFSSDDFGDDGGSVWDLTPDWQYDGRFVDAGGLTQSEKEEAIADVEEQARSLSDSRRTN